MAATALCCVKQSASDTANTHPLNQPVPAPHPQNKHLHEAANAEEGVVNVAQRLSGLSEGAVGRVIAAAPAWVARRQGRSLVVW